MEDGPGGGGIRTECPIGTVLVGEWRLVCVVRWLLLVYLATYRALIP